MLGEDSSEVRIRFTPLGLTAILDEEAKVQLTTEQTSKSLIPQYVLQELSLAHQIPLDMFQRIFSRTHRKTWQDQFWRALVRKLFD